MLTAALASREALVRPRDLAKVTVSWNLCFRISQAAFLQGCQRLQKGREVPGGCAGQVAQPPGCMCPGLCRPQD